MARDYASMDRAALEEALRKLRLDLEDIQETIEFNFTHTRAHMNAGQVAMDEETLAELKAEIAEVERRLTELH